MIKINNLKKTFGRGKSAVQALKGVSFEVKPGEVFALLGPNGSGKTTTLNILSKLLDPDSGEFEVAGKLPTNPGYFENISFMSGDSELYWAFPVEVSLKFYAELHGIDWGEVEVLVEEFSAKSLLSRSWMALSNGEKTKIRLVQSLLNKPKILFLDEPTVGLDPDVSEMVRGKLKDLNAAGLTLVLTSHYMKDIDTLASRVAFIRKGEIVEVADRAEYGTIDQLEQRFIDLAREVR